jgi:hypothetical protein
VTGIFCLLMVCAEAFAAGRHRIAGLSFVVAAVNAAIRIMFTMGRELRARRPRHRPGPGKDRRTDPE